MIRTSKKAPTNFGNPPSDFKVCSPYKAYRALKKFNRASVHGLGLRASKGT